MSHEQGSRDFAGVDELRAAARAPRRNPTSLVLAVAAALLLALALKQARSVPRDSPIAPQPILLHAPLDSQTARTQILPPAPRDSQTARPGAGDLAGADERYIEIAAIGGTRPEVEHASVGLELELWVALPGRR